MEYMNLTYWLGHTFFRNFARGFYDFSIVGSENMKFDGASIIACNHVSFLDPPIVGQAFDETIYSFARKTLFDHPIGGRILRQWQAIPVDRDKPDTASLKSTMRLLKTGKKILMFPEGTRSHDGKLQKAEAGIGFFLAKTAAPVLPVRLYGTYEACPRKAKFLHRAKITLVVGQKYQPDIHANHDRALYQSLSDEVMQQIASLTI